VLESVRLRLDTLEDAGVQRTMQNWRDDYDDVEDIAALDQAVIGG
jgi:hypothetical protein